jgi:hypothetical protein
MILRRGISKLTNCNFNAVEELDMLIPKGTNYILVKHGIQATEFEKHGKYSCIITLGTQVFHNKIFVTHNYASEPIVQDVMPLSHVHQELTW